MIELTPLSKITEYERSYIIALCKKGKVAHKTDGTHYLVSLEDVAWHVRQRNLLAMTDKNYRIALTANMQREYNIDETHIMRTTLQPTKLTRAATRRPL